MKRYLAVFEKEMKNYWNLDQEEEQTKVQFMKLKWMN
jgi:hypothetical protein